MVIVDVVLGSVVYDSDEAMWLVGCFFFFFFSCPIYRHFRKDPM